MRCAYSSSPNAVKKRTSVSSNEILCAMFLPTPPKDVVDWPGLESPEMSGLYDFPPISILTPPMTTTYEPLLRTYPFPAIYPFFMRLEI